MLGFCKWPKLLVVWRGSWFKAIDCGLIVRNASITTFPFTDWIGSTTTATALSESASNDCWVLMSTPESQHPNPGWEWYHPTTISGLPVCLSMSSIFAWNTGSTASTETPCNENNKLSFLKIQFLTKTHGSRLWHSENVDHIDGVVVDEFSKHQPHHFHGNSGSSVFEHLQQRQRRNVDGFRGVDLIRVLWIGSELEIFEILDDFLSKQNAITVPRFPPRPPSRRNRSIPLWNRFRWKLTEISWKQLRKSIKTQYDIDNYHYPDILINFWPEISEIYSKKRRNRESRSKIVRMTIAGYANTTRVSLRTLRAIWRQCKKIKKTAGTVYFQIKKVKY